MALTFAQARQAVADWEPQSGVDWSQDLYRVDPDGLEDAEGFVVTRSTGSGPLVDDEVILVAKATGLVTARVARPGVDPAWDARVDGLTAVHDDTPLTLPPDLEQPLPEESLPGSPPEA